MAELLLGVNIDHILQRCVTRAVLLTGSGAGGVYC